MKCIVLSNTNKEESILYKDLLKLANNDELLANRYYNSFNTESFINDFGDYINDFKNNTNNISKDRIDDNGEPKLFKDNDYNRYFYINKNQEKIYFPNKSLNNILTSNSLNNIKKTLGAQYILNNFNLSSNFDDLNFDETSTNTLSNFILDKLNNKKQYFDSINSRASKIKSKRIELLLNHIDELKDEVIDYFKTLKINYVEDENDLENIFNKEEDTREYSFNVASFERSSKENVNTDIKIMLSLIPNYNENSFDEIFNEPSFYSFNEVYSSLLKILSNTTAINNESLYEQMLLKLEKEKEFQPFIKNLLILLDNVSTETKNKFANAFQLSKNDMFTVEISKDYDKNDNLINYQQKVFSVTETSSKSSRMNNEWSINFNNKFINNNSFNYELFNNFSNKFNDVYNYYTELFKKDLNIDDIILELNPLINVLNEINVNVTKDGLNHFLRHDLDDINDINTFKYKFSNILIKINYFKTDLLNKKFNPLKEDALKYENIFKKLAESESIFISEGSESSIFAVGKTKWTFSKPSYVKNKVETFKKYPEIIKNEIISTHFNKNSRVLNYLSGSDLKYISDEESLNIIKSRLNQFDVGIFNNLQEEGDLSNSVDNKDVTTNDEIAMYVNSLLSFNINNDPIIRTVTPADKSTQLLLKLPKEIFVKTNYNINTNNISDDAIDVLYNYFIDEYNRMHQVSQDIENYKNDKSIPLYVHYHLGAKNGLKSQLFESLSVKFDKKGQVINAPSLFDEDGNQIILYDNITGYPVLNGFSKKVENSIKKYIKTIVLGSINDIVNEILEIGLIEGLGKSATINNAIDSNIFKIYNDSNQFNLDNIKHELAADIYINGIIQQIEYSKIFTGDYAFYKNMIDFKKRVPATYTDGQYLNTNDQFFNISVINSVEGSTPFKNEFNELVKEGVINESTANYYTNNNINIADAQAWITPERWKFILNGLGKWDSYHDIVYSKMLNKNKEPYTEKELKILMQPLKGVYFNLYNGKPTFLKYSQAVLVPSLIKGTTLEKLYNKMTSNKNYDDQIHEVITLDGVKAGALNPSKIHKDDDATEVRDDFELNKQVLLNSGWKLQQDLPTKTVKTTDVGSQIQKNVFQGLANNLDSIFIYKNKEVKGFELINIINGIVGDLSLKGLTNFYNELGIDENGKIENKEMFFNSLANQLISQDGNKNIINALKQNVNPIGIPQAYEKIMNMFASMALDRIVKIKTNGGSFIQMSDFGINKNEAENKGVLWTPWSKNKVNSYELLKDENGNIRRNSEGKPFIKPAGILISGSFIAKYIPDYRSKTIDELFGKLNNKTGKYEGGIVDYDILSNIIGYRIPNQGLSSNDAFEIVGILPEEVGDTIVAYTGITTKTGSDFDIDKMYMMIPSYKYVNNKLIYEESLENDLIESYKSVFTNSNVLNDLLTPIDFDFIKNDTVTFNPVKKETDTSYFNAINDIKTKSEYKAGKAGVGMEANALVDHVRGSMANLRFKQYNLGAGHIENGETVFDKEYSVELNNSDISLYVNYYNKNTNDKISVQDVESLKKIKISHSISAILNAFVDIAKDPYITRGNWNTTTTNIGNMLLRAGVHPFHVNAFLRHPVLKKYIDFQNNKESKIVNDTGNIENKFKLELLRSSSIFETEINLNNNKYTVAELHKLIYKNYLETDFNNLKYNNILNKIKKSKIKSKDGSYVNITNEQIESNLSEWNRFINIVKDNQILFLKSSKIEPGYFPSFKSLLNDNSIEFERKLLTVFNKLKEDAKKLKKNIDASTQDVRGFGSNSISLITRYNTINDMLSNDQIGDLIGFETKLNYNNQLTVLGHYTNNVINKMLDVISNNQELFFTIDNNIINNFNQISLDLKNTKLLDEELGKDIEKKFISYIFSGFKGIKTTNDEYKYLTSENFINDFKDFRNRKLNRYKILEELDIVKGDDLSFINMSNRKKDSSTQYDLTKSWLDMLNNDKEMGVNLIKYSYITSGFNMNKGQFYTLIPYEYFVENDINSYLKNIKIDNLDINFIEQFYENNYDNSKFVPNFFTNQIIKDSGNENTGFMLDINHNDAKRYVKKEYIDEKGVKSYKLFKIIGFDKDFKPIYIRVIPKGYKDKKGNRFYQYSFNSKIETPLKPFSENLYNNIIEQYNKLSQLKVYDFNIDKIQDQVIINNDDVTIENEMTVESDSLFENISSTKVYKDLVEMFNQTPDLFNKIGINSEKDFNNKSEEELGEIIKKLCK